MSTLDTRREQMFPKLEPRGIDRIAVLGEGSALCRGEAGQI
jgi:hypothetical protein